MFRAALAAPASFASVKCRAAIPGAEGLVKDALVQASLDPCVRAIDYRATAALSPTTVVPVEAIVLERDDGRFHLDIVAARPLRTIEDEGLFLIALEQLGLSSLVLSSAQIMQQPRFSSSRAVWRCRNHPVPFSFRCRVLQHLDEVGPTRLGRLLKKLGAEPDGGAAIFALACANQICLDLSDQALGPDTQVVARR
ncbi:hypothetical protein [Bradyrhizobium sp. F1.13.3]|uniref:hypothetical protein n=1 Tax=Bradyrhizobium sp. F1.13.3 TaxID=3156351 RepID=UPI003392BE6A